MSRVGVLHVDAEAALRSGPGVAWRCAKKCLAFSRDGELDEHNLTLEALEALLRLDLLGGADSVDLVELAIIIVPELLRHALDHLLRLVEHLLLIDGVRHGRLDLV